MLSDRWGMRNFRGSGSCQPAVLFEQRYCAQYFPVEQVHHGEAPLCHRDTAAYLFREDMSIFRWHHRYVKTDGRKYQRRLFHCLR